MEYTIAAIPTLYRGRMYRSRLEARWAAFFDLLGWRHEYEPFDLGLWSPDFLLPDFKALVEIKPITEVDPETFERALRACRQRGMIGVEDEEAAVRCVVLLGVAPIVTEGHCQIGWWGIENTKYLCDVATLVWIVDGMKPQFVADIATIYEGGFYCASGDAGPFPANHPRWIPWHFPHHAMARWSRATNLVQWKAPQ